MLFNYLDQISLFASILKKHKARPDKKFLLNNFAKPTRQHQTRPVHTRPRRQTDQKTELSRSAGPGLGQILFFLCFLQFSCFS